MLFLGVVVLGIAGAMSMSPEEMAAYEAHCEQVEADDPDLAFEDYPGQYIGRDPDQEEQA